MGIDFEFGPGAGHDLSKPATIIRVAEGPRAADKSSRVFTVVMTRRADDLAIVATATDPKTGLQIPAAGSPWPGDDTLVARPPLVFPVGLKDKDSGAMLCGDVGFYNLRVKYVPKSAEGSV